MRQFLIALAVIVAFTSITSSQRIVRDSDPKAFRIATRAGLIDTFKKVERLKRQLAGIKDPALRRDYIEKILDAAQQELNDDANAGSVIAVKYEDLEDGTGKSIPTRWHGAYKALEEDILSTGDEGLQIYEEIYGVRAKALLENALADNDDEQIDDVSRRFGLSAAGRDAAIHLASIWFEEGQFSRCARALERTLRHRSLVGVERQTTLSARLAHCYHALGERANMQNLIVQSTELKTQTLDIGGETKTLDEVLKAYLETVHDATLDTIEGHGVETVGGNYTNTGLHPSPVTYAKSAWSLTLPRQMAIRGPNIKKYPALLAPSQQPLFDGNFVYVNNGDSLLAYDLLAAASTRTPSWTCKPFPNEEHNWYIPEPDTALVQTVSTYQGMVYAALENPLSDHFHSRRSENMFGLYSHYPSPRRALCAVDSATGRVLWKRGGMYAGTIEDQTNYLHSIVYNGVLYAVATRVRGQAEIFLYALKPTTGEKIWTMRLCYGQQETTMFGRPAREPITSQPAFAGGKMFLNTNIGGVVSVNLQTRSLSWIARYEYIPRPTSMQTFTEYRNTAWYNNPTIYTEYEGKSYVVVAPADSNYLLALDAKDGTILWKISRTDARIRGALSLVGVRKGLVYVAASEPYQRTNPGRLVSLKLDSGNVVRSLGVTAGAGGAPVVLAGRPCMTNNAVLWPSRVPNGKNASGIVEIGLDSMGVLKSTPIPASWGLAGFSVSCQHGIVFNVIGRNFTDGNCKLDVRYDAAGLLDRARKALKEHPEDPEAALRYGQLAIRLGDKSEGIQYLKKAYELSTQGSVDRQVQFKASFTLVSKYLESADQAILKRRYDEAAAWVQNAREYALTRMQRTECFLRDERILIMRNDKRLLHELYESYISADPDFGIGADPEIPVRIYCQIQLSRRLATAGDFKRAVELFQTVQEAPSRLAWGGIPLRAYALGNLRQLINENGRELYAPQDRKAAELLLEGKPAAYESILLRYPLSVASDEAALRIAEANRKKFVPEIGMNVLRDAIEENPESPRMAELQAELAICLHAYGETLRSRLLASRILRENPKGELSINGESRTFARVLTPLTKTTGGDDVASVVPRLPSSMRQLWAHQWDVRAGDEDDEPLAEFRSVLIPVQPGTADAKYGFVYGSGGNGENELIAKDLKTGDVAWSYEGVDSVRSSWPMEHSTLFALNTGFMRLDNTGTLMWRATTLGTPRSIDLAQGMIVFTNNWFDRQARRQMVRVTAIDAETGSKVWESSVSGRDSVWIKQLSTGIVLCATDLQQTFYLLDYESGEVQHALKHTKAGRLYAKPIFGEDTFKFIDQRGDIYEHSALDLAQKSKWPTGESHPTMFSEQSGKYFVVGYQGATCFDPAAGKAVWSHRHERNEATSASHLTAKTLFIATRLNGTQQIMYGLHLDDGKVSFRKEHPRDEKTDQILLVRNAGFDEGIVLISVIKELKRGMKIKGFRCVVYQDDGEVRTDWKIRAPATATPFVQLAIIDKHILFSCSTTMYCLGMK
ncbi:PQQ-binding-like beta-propeller repeat protein [Planctomycetota bacterium]|nr:PQQ-binding-like beta-propeller repeat protein [Planctomycetota bacterium]